MELNNMDKLIKKYENWLAVAEQHKANNVEYRDTDINETIANYKQMLSIFKCPKFQQEIAGVWNK
jgi:glutaredoxin-related protein